MIRVVARPSRSDATIEVIVGGAFHQGVLDHEGEGGVGQPTRPGYRTVQGFA
jgi:hypothetical protein